MNKEQPIKFFEVLNWLFSDEDIPQRFIDQKTKLNSIVPYITEQLWLNPQLTWYLNLHTNNLYGIPDPIEQLFFFKKLIKIRQLTKLDLWKFIPAHRSDSIKEIEEREGYDEGNARGKEIILRHKIGVLASQELYKRQKATKAAVKQATTKEDKEFIKDLLEQEEIQKKKPLERTHQISLDNLTQEVIEREGLVLFDVSLLKKTNRILFIFIDKENKKRYYTEPFQAEIYISKKDGIINNDYIENITDDFIKYNILDIAQYNKLKYIINDNYKRIINGGDDKT